MLSNKSGSVKRTHPNYWHLPIVGVCWKCPCIN